MKKQVKIFSTASMEDIALIRENLRIYFHRFFSEFLRDIEINTEPLASAPTSKIGENGEILTIFDEQYNPKITKKFGRILPFGIQTQNAKLELRLNIYNALGIPHFFYRTKYAERTEEDFPKKIAEASPQLEIRLKDPSVKYVPLGSLY